jgi:23S rRNA-/tRNA-specific pseudouridylate synthase
MVFARTEVAKRALQSNWNQSEKKYLAVVDGRPKAEKGTLRSHLDETNPYRVRSAKASEVTREAVTHYVVKQTTAKRALVELTLETGRRHQIPVVGDPKYHPSGVEDERLALHSSGLKIKHPITGEVMVFESELPGDLARLLSGK